MHDSDNIIPPSNGGPPRSYVPYLSIARAGRMQREGAQDPASPGKVFKGDQVSQLGTGLPLHSAVKVMKMALECSEDTSQVVI